MASLLAAGRTGYFYPRSPCGERRSGYLQTHQPYAISIHALLAESDRQMPLIRFFPGIFLSTLSLRRATCRAEISENQYRHFYPRSPCGERQWIPSNSPTLCYFYPRSPCGERRNDYVRYCIHARISIHALLAESDHLANLGRNRHQKFLSTLSLRRAT